MSIRVDAMRGAGLCAALAVFCLAAMPVRAAEFGQVQGVVHDPQHRPLAGASVTVRAARSSLEFSAVSDRNGAFSLPAVPLGDYIVSVTDAGFAPLREAVAVMGGSAVMLHLQMEIAAVQTRVNVVGAADEAGVETATPETQISRVDIAETPGADRTNSLAMVTDFVPGAYITHDMLHMRGGHQLSWLIDGVEIPNTNIASNIAPQIDPKDIDTLQIDRGSYAADLGDRTYGVFDVLPRTGFERDREGELVLSAGSFDQTNDQVSLGDHTEKFAWYASANGDRSNYGLQPPVGRAVHDAENGYGGFASLIYNRDPADQLRYVTQLRTDYYQVPYDPDASDWQNHLYNSSGLRDGEHETDSYGAFTWLHTFSPVTTAEVSPFYHFNRASYQPGAADEPTATTAEQSGFYSGLKATFSTAIARNTVSGGIYGYAQHENDLFAVNFNDGRDTNFRVNPIVAGGVEEAFVGDTYKPAQWLTLTGGERQSHFTGALGEGAIYPRIGVALRAPRLNWVFRAFYGHFYQPPPLTSITGPALAFVQNNQDTFVPLRGERDEEHQFGVQIPWRGWVLDADTFQTEAKNFLDHTNVGESNLFIPVTVEGALVQAWEVTLRTPRLWRYGQGHLAYSNQIARQRGPATGGLVCYSPANPDACAVSAGYTALDHDQRNTLNVGFNGVLPRGVTAAFNMYYGSGFSNGFQDAPSPYSGAYLPSHTTVDILLGKDITEKISASVTATNIANTRVLLDNSLTFGGFHYNDPRQLYGEVRYRFKF